MNQQLRVRTITEDQSSVTSTYVRQLTTACKSSARIGQFLSPPLASVFTYIYTCSKRKYLEIDFYLFQFNRGFYIHQRL